VDHSTFSSMTLAKLLDAKCSPSPTTAALRGRYLLADLMLTLRILFT
jgi:hypothetical protein